MQSSDSNSREREPVLKAVWLLLGVSLNTLELFIPRIPFLPWLKPGLANSITIIWIIKFGMTDALLYTLLRVWISSFYFGFSLVTMGLALSGGLLSTAAMGIAWRLLGGRRLLGTVGVGTIGAVMHNAGQLIAVYFLLTRNNALFYQLPFMGIAALVFGGFVGIITPLLWRILVIDSPPSPARPAPATVQIDSAAAPAPIGAILAILAGAASLVAMSDMRLLGGIAAAVTLIAFFSRGRTVSTLLYPLRFWVIFLFIGFIYLFFSYGTRIPFLPFVTREGAAATAAQFLRLWTWLQAGLLLQALHCHRLLFVVLKRLFPHHAETLLAGLLALEYFPDVISFVKGRKIRSEIDWRRPLEGLVLFINRVQAHVLRVDRGGGGGRDGAPLKG
ncbi:MAG: Gx transporter family protein [Chitinispirillaceae bacterium]|nr:Gx transporter family protein [Chitinispirillaceae bacterium]